MTIPAALTAAITPGARTGWRETVAVRFVDAVAGGQSAAYAGEVGVTFAQETGLQLANRFVSFTGWVKPGETFPLQLEVENFDATDATGATVTLSPTPGATLLGGTALDGNGTAVVNPDGTLTWSLGTVAAATADGPGLAVLIVEAQAASLAQDERIVWKDLSMEAVLNGTQTSVQPRPQGHPASPAASRPPATATSLFPMVPVEYTDLGRQADEHRRGARARGQRPRRSRARRSTSTRR